MHAVRIKNETVAQELQVDCCCPGEVVISRSMATLFLL
jgi:hypothetical protein